MAHPGKWLSIALAFAMAIGSSSSTALAAGRKSIRTYQDFEGSSLYKELRFTNTKNESGYRIYKDQNNNYVIALQIDKNGNILTERILPLPKVGSKAQNVGMVFFVMDFIFGDGAALNDISATNQLNPHIASMSTPNGAQIGNFRVCLAQDPWKIRVGFDVKTRSAKPWNLALPGPKDTNAEPLAGDTSESSSSKKTEGTENSPAMANLQSELKTSKGLVVSLQKQLRLLNEQLSQNTASLSTAMSENQRIQTDLINQYDAQIKQITFERDVAIGKIQNLEADRDALTTRLNKALAPARSEQVTIVHTPVQASDKTAENSPTPTDTYVDKLPGFQARAYRMDVERRINHALHPLTPHNVFARARAEATFAVMPDGCPGNIHITVLEPTTNEELSQKISERVRHIIESAAPFRPISLYSLSAIRMRVEFEQMVAGNSYTYSISARYAEIPNRISSHSNLAR